MSYTIWNFAPIVLAPFAAFVVNSFIVKKFTKVSVFLSCVAIFISMILSMDVFYQVIIKSYSAEFLIQEAFNWFDISHGQQAFKVDLGIYIDNMGAIALLMVTTVAFLIHIFSTWYMKEDKRYGAFFVYLSLFTSAMLGLVLSNNLLSFFCFWELMGFCSYSLIGFYYQKEGAGNASIKAFMTTRIGDVFFLLGILIIWNIVGSVNFVDIYAAISQGKFSSNQVLVFGVGVPVATLAAISIFMGTVGKSAQVPLQVWLPDAMWGPTPCSALIHAATMVAAGVYLSLRMYPLMDVGNILPFIAWVGGITAFIAATIATIQTDIKAVLAYSTISQLGYMVLGVGVGAYAAAFMHLITHAVFKACLFLSAGSVIHSLHDHHTHQHVQEMPRMGGLRHKMPLTFLCMLLCTFAIAGIPLWSGFVSKDRILGDALLTAEQHGHYVIPVLLGFVAALLTSFYMFRMMFLTFFKKPRDMELYNHIKKEKFSFNRNLPLLILAVFTLGFWYSGSLTGQGYLKLFRGHYEWFVTLVERPDDKVLNKFVERYSQTNEINNDYEGSTKHTFIRSNYDPFHGMEEERAHHVHKVHVWVSVASCFIALAGLILAFLLYIRKNISVQSWSKNRRGIFCILENKYYFDYIYNNWLIQRILFPIERFLAWVDMGIYDRYAVDGWQKVCEKFYTVSKWFDNIIVDKIAVDGSGASVRFFNVILRAVQSGKIQFYFIVLILVIGGYILQLKIG